MTKILNIEGMTCGHCVIHIQKALNAIDGVKAVVDLVSQTAIVELDESVDDKILKEVVQGVGYKIKSIQ